MTDIQAALGLSQMSRLDEFVARRQELARLYDSQLADLPVEMQRSCSNSYSAMHLYIIRLTDGADNGLHRKVFEHMRTAGIGVNLHYIPVHTQPVYRRLGFETGDFPEAEAYYSQAITLPMFPGMRNEDISIVVQCLKEALQ